MIDRLPFEAGNLEISSKIKQFLNHIALGMAPKKTWDGTSIAGGCTVVKVNGRLVVYTLYDMDRFNNYLINSTELDTVSTTRHRFGNLYTGIDGRLYFDLSANIRFTN